MRQRKQHPLIVTQTTSIDCDANNILRLWRKQHLCFKSVFYIIDSDSVRSFEFIITFEMHPQGNGTGRALPTARILFEFFTLSFEVFFLLLPRACCRCQQDTLSTSPSPELFPTFPAPCQLSLPPGCFSCKVTANLTSPCAIFAYRTL